MLAARPALAQNEAMGGMILRRRRKLSDQVRVQVLDLIEQQRLRVGDALPSERELMEQFGVGRPAVREALQSLEAAGLVTIRHGDRARVAEPSIGRMVEQVGETMSHILVHSPASLENLKEARAIVERELARTAARRATRADIERLEETLSEQARLVGESKRFRRLDGRFHREIAAISGNPIFTALVDAVFGWLAEFHADLVAVPGLEELTLREHREILDAIAAGDVEGAGQAMMSHLMRANALYRLPPVGEA
jgi:GntR family transcriptional regulator, sialic acid-inducible nan operon repressor